MAENESTQSEHTEGGAGPSSEDGHDDHITLQYQPALPIPNGKVILWLFLSTEIMFFAGLIGTYIVLRFGAPTGTWPTPHDVHVVEWMGALNTFVLICSSVTIVLALEAAKAKNPARAKTFLLLTFVLGTLFLGVKAVEYNSKFSHGIHPAKRPGNKIYERADVYYIAAVRDKLLAMRTDLDNKKAELVEDGEQLSDKDVKLLELYNELVLHLADWTRKKVATTDDPHERQAVMDVMAYAVYPYPARGDDGSKKYLEEYIRPYIKYERRELTSDRARLVQEIEELKTKLESEAPDANPCQDEPPADATTRWMPAFRGT